MNARAAVLVADIQSASKDLREIRVKLWGLKERYVSEGGQPFIHEHFVEADGVTPRTDLDITEAKILAAISMINTMLTTLDANKDSIIQAAA